MLSDEFLANILQPRCAGGSCGPRVPLAVVQQMARELIARRASESDRLERIEAKLDDVIGQGNSIAFDLLKQIESLKSRRPTCSGGTSMVVNEASE